MPSLLCMVCMIVIFLAMRRMLFMIMAVFLVIGMVFVIVTFLFVFRMVFMIVTFFLMISMVFVIVVFMLCVVVAFLFVFRVVFVIVTLFLARASTTLHPAASGNANNSSGRARVATAASTFARSSALVAAYSNPTISAPGA